jgi:hypothetical protein
VGRNLGILMLILVLGVGLGVFGYALFELGGIEGAITFFSESAYNTKNSPSVPADALTEKKTYADEGNDTADTGGDIIPDIDGLVHKVLESKTINTLWDYYSRNITLNAWSEEIEGANTDYHSPYFYAERFAAYSAQLGMIDSYEMEIKQEFEESAGTPRNPLGADTYAVLMNSQLQVKRRLVMEQGETDNFKIIYTLKNLGGPYSKDKTELSYINLKTNMLVPELADLDGDGDLDMAVGDRMGKIYYFKNMGNSTNPYFVLDDSPTNNTDSNIFSNVYLTGGQTVGYGISLSFADLDNDGDYDLALGNSLRQYLQYYENTGTAASPAWQKTAMFDFLNSTYVYDTDFADFDNDGDLDMIAAMYNTSSNAGGIIYYENTGSASAPVWAYRWIDTFNLTATENIRQAEATDFDGDNDYDIIIKKDGWTFEDSGVGVKLIENIGTASSPSFRFVNNFTIYHGIDMPFKSGSFTVPFTEGAGMAAADLDGDGDDDLVLGNSNGTLTYYSRGSGLLEDLYLYEMPLLGLDNGTVSYDYATDSFSARLSNPDSTMMIYGDRASTKHGIHGSRWYYPYEWYDDGNPCDVLYTTGEDLFWADGELNNLDSYSVSGASGENYTCGTDVYNTSQQVSPVLGFYIGDLLAGEEKDLTVTYKFALGNTARNNPELSLANIQFLGDNVSFDVLNSGTLAVNPAVTLIDSYKGDVVKSSTFTLNTSVANITNVNILFKVDTKHTLNLIVDPLNKIVEDNENNNDLSVERKKYNVYLNMSMGSLNDVFKDYVLSKLSNYNIVNNPAYADYILFIGGDAYNTETLDKGFGIDGYALWFGKKGFKPYNGFVNALDNKIFVRGVSADGVAAALKYVDWAALSNSKHYVSDDDKEGLEVFDFFRTASNQPDIYKNNDAFKNIVHQALFGKYVESNETVKTLQGVVLNLKHLGNKNSDLLKQYLNVSSYPVVMAGGLWSDINAWKGLGQELADNGRDVWLAEITGGNNTECDVCNDYTYNDIVNYHVPAVVGGVVQYTGESKIQWVGHSNAGRAGLDFLTAHSTGMSPAGQYWDGDSYEFDSFAANPVETYVGVGVPGAFEGDSPFSRCMKTYGYEMLNKTSDKTHLSQKEVGRALITQLPVDPYCVAIGFLMVSDDKISSNLVTQYYNWINSTTDTQPGTGISGLNTAKIIYGTQDYSVTTDSDYVVSVADSIAIYGNINAGSKYLNERGVIHTEMTETKKVWDYIKEVIN